MNNIRLFIIYLLQNGIWNYIEAILLTFNVRKWVANSIMCMFGLIMSLMKFLLIRTRHNCIICCFYTLVNVQFVLRVQGLTLVKSPLTIPYESTGCSSYDPVSCSSNWEGRWWKPKCLGLCHPCERCCWLWPASGLGFWRVNSGQRIAPYLPSFLTLPFK